MKRLLLLLLLAVMITVKVGALNTLVSHIDVCKSGPGAVCIVGWVYDSGIKNWTLGRGIDVYAIASTCPPEGYPGYDSNHYEQYRDGEIEYVERPDVNAAFGLSGKHGFRIKINIDAIYFDEKREMPLYVRVIANVNNGNGYEDIVLSYVPDVTVRSYDGDGLDTAPYTIYDANDWNVLADALLDADLASFYTNCYYQLSMDFDNSVAVTKVLGTSTSPFSGHFEGNGQTLMVNINNPDGVCMAPFGHINNATIENLKVTGTVSGGMHSSGLVGGTGAGSTNTISNCWVNTSVIINGSHGGGIIGHGGTSTTTINNCLFDGSISGATTATGVIYGWGDTGEAILTNCYATGNISGGGIDFAKKNNGSPTVNNCYKSFDSGSYGTYTTAKGKALKDLLGDGWSANGKNVVPSVFAPTGGVNTFVEVGEGEKTSEYLPCYDTFRYSYSQQIYHAAEIGATGSIESIAFKNANMASTRTVAIYMKQTEKNTFDRGLDWVSMGDADLVFSGDVSFDDGEWTTIMLDSPFDYDGNSNLIVGVADNTGSWASSSHLSFLVYEASDQALYKHTNVDAYDVEDCDDYGWVMNVKNRIQLGIAAFTGSDGEEPTWLKASDVASQGATLVWTGGCGNYNVEYKKPADTEWTPVNGTWTVENGQYSTTLTGLEPNTTYQAHVQSICGSSVSGWKSIKFTTLISCPSPTGLAVALLPDDGTRATLSWKERGTATQWQICLNDDEDNLITANSNPFTLTGLTPETAYTAKVRAVGNGEYSSWGNTVSFIPTNASTLTVNDGTITNGLVPVYGYYADYYSKSQFIIPATDLSTMQGSEILRLSFYSMYNSVDWGEAQFEVYMKEVDYTTFAGGTMVDWNDMELVRNAGSLSVSGHTMQVLLDYPWLYSGGNLLVGFRVISKASYYDTNTCYWYGVQTEGNVSMGGYDDRVSTQDGFLPKMTFSYIQFDGCQRPFSVKASYTGGADATVSWKSDASAFNVKVNGTLLDNPQITKADGKWSTTLTGLDMATDYTVCVQTDCGGGNTSVWSPPALFSTNLCLPEDQCIISYELHDSYGDGWQGNAIRVVDVATGKTLSTWTISSGNSASGILNVCKDREIQFVWVAGSYSKECSFTIYDVNGEIICQHVKDDKGPAAGVLCTHTVYCTIDNCARPYGLALVSKAKPRQAELTWTNGSDDQSAWEISVLDGSAVETILTANSSNIGGDLQSPTFTLTGLTPETTYTVKVRSDCGTEKSRWSNECTFTTDVSCPAPTDLTVTLTPGDGSVVTLNWTENDEATQWQISLLDASAVETIVTVDAMPYTLTDLIAETDYTVKVRAVGNNEYSSWSNSAYFMPTDCYQLTVTDGSTDTNTHVPIDGLYADEYSKSQFIIPAASLNTLAGCEIDRMTFYANTASASWGKAQFEVYMKEVDFTAFAEATLVDWNDMKMVKKAGSLAVNGYKMEVALDEPYTYHGGNLLIGFRQAVNGSYRTVRWIGINTDGMVSLGGHDNEVSNQNGFLPKISFWYMPVTGCQRPTNMQVSYTEGNTAVVCWESDASAWNVRVNGNVIAHPQVTKVNGRWSTTLTGLEMSTVYNVCVQADCGNGSTSYWTHPVSFTTDLCMPEDQCLITLELTDLWGDSWGGSAIEVIDVATGQVFGSFTNVNLNGTSSYGENETNTYILSVCKDREIRFQWVGKGWSDSECSYVVTDVNGNEIFKGSGSLETPVSYTVNCTLASCVRPKDLALSGSAIHDSAVLTWTPGSDDQTAWDIGFRKSTDTDYTVTTAVTSNPYTLTGLIENTSYVVAVRGNCGGGDVSNWSRELTFTTPIQFPAPTALNMIFRTRGSAVLGWTAGSTETAWQIAYSSDEQFDPETATKEQVTTNPFELIALTEGATYHAAVRADYGNGHYSNWSAAVSFVPKNELTVYDGTDNDFRVPFVTYHYNSQFKCSQFVIPATDIDVLAGCNITALRFYKTARHNSITVDAPIQVYLSEVDATSTSDYVPRSSATTVYQGTIDFNPNIVTITFTTPYPYSGGNLLVGVENTQKSSDYFYVSFYGQEVEGASVYGTSSDNRETFYTYVLDFMPKTTICFEDDGTVKAPRNLKVSNLTNHQATLSWRDATRDADRWEIKITSDGGVVQREITEKPFTLTELTKETNYDVQIRVKRGEEYSDWSDQVAFTTYGDNYKVFAANGQWDVDANWQPAGVPTSDHSVYLRAVANIPDGVTASVKEIVVEEGGQLIVKDGGQLKSRSDVENVTFEKNITGHGGTRGHYRLLAHPIANTSLTIASFSDDAWDNHELYVFKPANELEWALDGYGTRYSVSQGNGFLYANVDDKTLRFTGKVTKTQDDENHPMVASANVTYNAESTDDYNGWLLVGNPYACNCTLLFFDENNKSLPVTFYKMNAEGSGYDVYENFVVLAPCEGAFLRYGQSGRIIFYADLPNNALTKAREQAWPALPEHGVTSDQDASVVAEIALNDMADNTSLLADNDRRTVNATLNGRRFWYDNTWNTLTLPFSLNAEEIAHSPLAGATIKEFDVVNYYDPANVTILGTDPFYSHFDAATGLLRLYFRDVTAIEAGKPYFFRKNGTAVTLTATAGTQGYDGQGYDHLFDGQYSGRWSSGTTHRGDQPWFVEFSASVPVYVTRYTLFTADNTQSVLGCNPTVWTLYGRRYAGDRWTAIDSRNTSANSSDGLLNSNSDQKSYSVAPLQRGTYQYFRLEISQIEGGETMQLGEFMFDNLDRIDNPRFRSVGIRNDTPTPVTTKDGPEVSLQGIFNPLEIAANDKSVLFLAGDNNLYYPTYAMTIGAFRAYYYLNGITAKDINHVRMGFDENSQTIGIDSSFFTLHSSFKEGWYTLDGRKLDQEPTRRGVYIKDGRKVVVRGNR